MMEKKFKKMTRNVSPRRASCWAMAEEPSSDPFASPETSLRIVLISYCVYYAPERLSEVPDMLQRSPESLEAMRCRYGRVTPTPQEVTAACADPRTMAYVILAKCNPKRSYHDLEAVLDEHSPEDVLLFLRDKYRVGVVDVFDLFAEVQPSISTPAQAALPSAVPWRPIIPL